MANARAENFPVYLAEATCNASHQAASVLLPSEPSADEGVADAAFSRDKSKFMAVILLQKRGITHPRKRGGAFSRGDDPSLAR